MSEVEVASEVEERLHHPARDLKEMPYPNQIYAWYVVAVLVVAYTFSFIDRQILSLLVGPIKRDLVISDTQMSLLQGLAFAIFYTLMGLPIGRMVDRSHRIRIITIGVIIWSLMTAACGMARNYWQLFTFRMGVGVGEAALTPSAYSIIADYFHPKRLGFALGIYGMGVYIGAGLALVIGAEVINYISRGGFTTLPLIGDVYSWQVVFFAVGLPGILVGLWVMTLREPVRRGHMRQEVDASGVTKAVHVPVREVMAYMWINRATVLPLNLSYALSAMMAYGVSAWIPTFFIRSHGWTAVEAGRWYGLVIVVFGTLGVVSGGWLGDFLTSRGYRNGRMIVVAFTGLIAMPFTLAYPLVNDPWVALYLLAPSTYFATFTTGSGPAALQELMPNQMRGFASAVMIFIVTLVGLGLGPTSIAVVTDYYYGDEQMLRYSLVVVPTVILTLAVVSGLWALRNYNRSLDYVADWALKNEK